MPRYLMQVTQTQVWNIFIEAPTEELAMAALTNNPNHHRLLTNASSIDDVLEDESNEEDWDEVLKDMNLDNWIEADRNGTFIDISADGVVSYNDDEWEDWNV